MIKSAIFPIEEKYINDFEAFQLYQSMRLHFQTSSYNAIKYNYKSPCSTWQQYETVSKTEVNMYQKWASKYMTRQNLLIALAAHFHYNNPRHTLEYSPTDKRVKEAYVKLKQFLYSPKYFITKDLTYIKQNATIDIIRTTGNIPKIYPMSVKGLISEESLIAIDISLNLTKYISTKMKSIMWDTFKQQHLKYCPFVCETLDDELIFDIKETIKNLKQKQL